jgi:hypothetical protein
MLKLGGALKLNPLVSLRKKGKLISKPYLNSDLAVLILGETKLHGKLFIGVRTHPHPSDDDTELILFMKQNGEKGLKVLLRQISPGWNTTHTGIVEFDGITPARRWGNLVTEKFRWRAFARGAFQTRDQVKARLRSLGLNPAVMDCVFPAVET